MTSAAEPSAPPRRLQPEKRAAITRAARRVFGQDGYARASIDAIAAEAGVSTRTIYKHFENKERLFTLVLEGSATEVAESFLRRLAAVPSNAADIEEELVGIGLAVLHQADDNPDHFAMVRQISAEAAHFPPTALAAWRAAGPLRVENALADRLRTLAARASLDVPDPTRAAIHFMALTTAERRSGPPHNAAERTQAETLDSIAAAVAVFLHGYAR